MYVPRHFADNSGFVLEEVVGQFPFAILVSSDAPFQITHLPLLHISDGSEWGSLIGHVAKPNPHGQLFDGEKPAVALFSGPHAYVSPNWYATQGHVPTWNYAAVHAHGRPNAVVDMDRATDILDRLVRAFESDDTGNWRLDQIPEKKLLGQLKGIIAFEMKIERFEVKAKLSQNRSPDDVKGVVSALSSNEHEPDRQTANWMQRVNAPGETEL